MFWVGPDIVGREPNRRANSTRGVLESIPSRYFCGSALVMQSWGVGRVLRVDLVTGRVTVVVASGLSGAAAAGIALEAGGAPALVTDRNGLVRVSLPQTP